MVIQLASGSSFRMGESAVVVRYSSAEDLEQHCAVLDWRVSCASWQEAHVKIWGFSRYPQVPLLRAA